MRHRSGGGEAGAPEVVATFVSDEAYCDVATKLMSAQGRYTVLGRTVRALPLAALP